MAFSIDSTLGDLLADDKAKAVLEKHMPGVSSMPGLDMAKGMSLRAIAPFSQGRLTEELLTAINEDLGKLE